MFLLIIFRFSDLIVHTKRVFLYGMFFFFSVYKPIALCTNISRCRGRKNIENRLRRVPRTRVGTDRRKTNDLHVDSRPTGTRGPCAIGH